MNIDSVETNFRRVKDIKISDSFRCKLKTGNSRIDGIFGDGLLAGSCISITGTPGAGKSTMILQILSLIESQGKQTAYSTGEESSEQLALTCERLGIDNIKLAHIKTVETIAESMGQYDIIIVDSFQSLTKPKGMKIGEFRQYAQDLLISKAKETGCILIFVLHITTSGLPKGGTDIIHAVDVNIKISVSPDESRILDVYKNRGGKTGKHSFIMTSSGFDFSDIKHPHMSNSIDWVGLLCGILTKSNNKKIQYLGRCVSLVDQKLKISNKTLI
jgi:DNA repair protein RadA/Sms